MSVGLGTFAMTRTKQHLITLRLLEISNFPCNARAWL